MATNLALDDELLREATKLGGFQTKRATVNAALAEFVQRRKAQGVVDAFGTVEYDPDYDYKELRRLRP